jgi:hypothetical protein
MKRMGHTRLGCRKSRTPALAKQLAKLSVCGLAEPSFRREVFSCGSEKRPSKLISSGTVELRPRFGCVVIANGSDKVEFRHASEHLACKIRTARVVAEVLGEQFFAPVRSREARLDRYLRNGEIPDPNISLYYSMRRRRLAQVDFCIPGPRYRCAATIPARLQVRMPEVQRRQICLW